MSDSTPTEPEPNDRHLLAGLMSLAGQHPAGWSATELAAIWKHQLNAPLLLDLGGLSADATATVTLHTHHAAAALQSFADLLAHPSPPIEILQLAKEFAKRQRYAEQAIFPIEIANILYYMSIALASLRHNQSITEMDESKLKQRIQWCLQQQWIDPATRGLFEAELTKLRASV
jgi:hypothetical protein